MYAQCEPDGHTYVFFDSINYFSQNTTALFYAYQIVRKADGRMFLRQSNAGWKLYVLWKSVSTFQGNLLDLKESHALDTAEYAVSQILERESAFNLWVPFVLKNHVRVIYLVK